MSRERRPSRVCEAPGCASVQFRERLPGDPAVNFVKFPTDPGKRLIWFRKLGCIPSSNQRLFLCLLHFEDCYIRKVGYNSVPLTNWSVENDAVPTLKLRPLIEATSPAVTSRRLNQHLLIGSPRKKQRSEADCK